MDDETKSKHQFWQTQPVPGLGAKVEDNTFIEAPLDVEKIRKEPYSLPEPFLWSEVDLLSNNQLDELYTLLNENYVEDDENMFRFDYGKDFLKWALMPSGWNAQWHCGVRAVPALIRIYDKTVQMVEINFLCVHKKLRAKRLAPVLIREITRRVNLSGIFQATFTAGIIIPKPVGSCRYWHRSLNPKKLIETRFSHLGKNMTLHRTIKLYRLPEVVTHYPLKPLEKGYLQSAFNLLTEYLTKFDICPIFNFEEFEHFFMSREDVVYSYIIEKNGQVTDFISFYCLPSTIVHNPLHKEIRAAYSFYNVAGSVPLNKLINDALIIAKNMGFDVFNALDLMENKNFLEELKFGIGDGNLQYYLYNWKCPDIAPERIVILLALF
ncbi:Glycylpeptide N-tetradecanoyltransferase [Meloidogyne graminicola]|uniref:Glycylpeptide N-tetradecanoyltransferase n=1 Tax=Meloidogyne graminicola TaxID=189291 RepID=A0A8T0A051_9BILA|nr:Glycylpeptide N-tetradecanoyltransferase [Meloidogyne graminicola]